MTTPQVILAALAAALMLAGAGANLAALIVYSRRPGASLLGFGYATYYYGEMRKTRPHLFRLALLGPLLGVAALLTAGFFKAG